MSKRVMIVEDEGLIANDIAGQLTKSGYQVVSISASGEEALSHLETSPADLVLMDIRLKGKLDGIDTAAKVRTNHNLPVIFLTSHADSETLSRAKQVEPFGYLVKPFRQLNLCSAIEMALHKHQSERVLAQRESWLTTILQSTAEPTIVTDSDSRIQFVNASAEQLLGLTMANAAGRHWVEAANLFDSATGACAEDLAPLALLRSTTLRLPHGLEIRRPGANHLEIEGEVAPSSRDGIPAGAVITVRDVTERNRNQAEVRHEQKMIAVGRMAGGIAHDFNNLLTVVLGHCSELALELQNGHHLARLRSVLGAVNTAAGITQQLLTLAGKRVAREETFSVNERIRGVSSILRSSLGLKIQLTLDLSASSGKVRMNPASLDQVLMNLLLNSRDAMPGGGEIVVLTEPCERTKSLPGGEVRELLVRISIKDSGIGIPKESQNHVFEPFFTTKPLGKGTGLGLPVVYGIVKDASGEITMESAPGEGTRVNILLPRLEDVEFLASEALSALPALDPKTVLLVEDQADIRALIHNYLEKQGFNLIEACDGEEALALAELHEGKIDLMISDILMPRVDGVELSRRLTALRPSMKVLLISGQPGDTIDLLRGSPLNAQFMAKPFALPKLLEKIRTLAA